MSKRVKISFETVNGNNYTIIEPKKIHESNQRIKSNMREVLKKIRKK